jgi:hypothetical protein
MTIDTDHTATAQHVERDVPVYTPDGPPRPSADELRARIPGWGVDLDPADRPSSPKLDFRPGLTGAHWRVPEAQPEHRPRERSIEHRFLTPVFGTAQPLRGLSGRLRRLAYARWSEARNAHWLALIAADRVDMVEGMLTGVATGRPDNILAETGVRAELKHGGLTERLGRARSDPRHHVLDPLIVLGPWLLAGWGAVALVRRLLR